MAKVGRNSRGGARPGERRGGRKKGTPNRVTATLKQAILDTFEKLGGAKHMTTWAKRSPSDFYRLASRLIPPGLPVTIEGLKGSLTDQGAAVINAMSAGTITPEQAHAVMDVLAAQSRAVYVDELERRLAAMEQRITETGAQRG